MRTPYMLGHRHAVPVDRSRAVFPQSAAAVVDSFLTVVRSALNAPCGWFACVLCDFAACVCTADLVG